MTMSKIERQRCLFIVWKGYQRRVEVLAPLFDADVKLIPHLFRSRYLRPLDYLIKFFATVFHIWRTRPDYALVQAPPHYAALPAIFCRLPFILDAHNGVFQSYWHKLPFFSTVMKKAKAVVVHNAEVERLFSKDYPTKSFYVIADPIQDIRVAGTGCLANQILFICSFDHDEPIDVIIDVIEQTPGYTFVITADPKKLPIAQRQRLQRCDNVHLPGFLSTQAYQQTLCESSAAIALTTMTATQQSGACEALSSDTPLIATRSSLSESLFGDWAMLVENTATSITEAIASLDNTPLDLTAHRKAWNARVRNGVTQFQTDVLNTPGAASHQTISETRNTAGS